MATLCLSGSALQKAGRNVDTDLSGGTILNGARDGFIVDEWIEQAEGTINSATRRNWVDDFAGLDGDVQGILQETCACLAGNECIKFDMSGYTTRGEAEDMISINRDTALRNISILRDIKTQTFIDGA